jgi:hypothetical protein
MIIISNTYKNETARKGPPFGFFLPLSGSFCRDSYEALAAAGWNFRATPFMQ